MSDSPVPPPEQPETEEEKRGVDAIIRLQALVGIMEHRSVALRNWRAFSQHERDQTIHMYELLFQPKG